MNKATLNSILKNGEDSFAELKVSFQKEVIESVVAFSNAKGGKILIIQILSLLSQVTLKEKKNMIILWKLYER